MESPSLKNLSGKLIDLEIQIFEVWSLRKWDRMSSGVSDEGAYYHCIYEGLCRELIHTVRGASDEWAHMSDVLRLWVTINKSRIVSIGHELYIWRLVSRTHYAVRGGHRMRARVTNCACAGGVCCELIYAVRGAHGAREMGTRESCTAYVSHKQWVTNCIFVGSCRELRDIQFVARIGWGLVREPPKNGKIALLLATNRWYVVKCVSQKRN